MTNDSQRRNSSNGTTTDEMNDDVADMVGRRDDAYDAVCMTIDRYILPMICAFGIIGIILTVIVLSRKNMRTSTNCYLTAFSVADLLFLVLLASCLIYVHFVPDSNALYAFRIYGTYATIVMNISLMSSVWLTVMLTVERYIAICQPFLAAKICTIKTSNCFIVAIFALSFVCRMPNFWENRVIRYYDSSANVSIHYMEPTEFSYNEHYMNVYPWVVDGVLTSIIPFILLLVLNLNLILEVKKSTRYLQSNTISATHSSSMLEREERQITIMLITIILVFIVCQAPYVFYTAAMNINKFDPSSGFLLFRDVTKLLLTLKSAINFIIYCWFSEKFWATLKSIVCLKRCYRLKRRSLTESYYSLKTQSIAIQITTI